MAQQEEYQIPIFLINGQLDSGKTKFISDTIAMGQFAEAQKKLLIVCEEGEEEYSEKLLKDNGINMVVLEKEEFTEEKLKELDKEYDPWIVIVEYNGMWEPSLIAETAKPKGWEIYQSITLIDACSFNLQWNNMRSIIAESVKNADMVIFNRSKSGMDLGSYRRSMRALNPALQIVFEDDKGEMLSIAEQLPYDVNAPVIEVDDGDYGIWYMDVSERPEIYVGKKVRFKGQVLKNKYFKDKNFVPGRKVMTCCAADTQFIGYISFYDNIASLENRQWVWVTATIKNEFQMAYKKKGPVLYVETVEPAEPPVEEMVYF
ncbi:MAG: GTP-binding protein [Lachnospira sp.]